MSELLSDLKCGIKNDHVAKEPIILSCGHFICKNCVPDHAKIICKICSFETIKSELKFDIESDHIKNRIKMSLSGLFDDLEKHATNKINKFKS